MTFKEWLFNEERLKGLKRQFLKSNQELPRYVGNQIYNNQIIPKFKKFMKNISPTIISGENDPDQTIIFNGEDTNKNSSYDSIKNNLSNTDGIVWSKNPITIQISPLDFDQKTLNTFINWRFGFNPKDNKVRNDTARFDIQRNILDKNNTGSNEPIILIKFENKYRLIEGFHRTMTCLIWEKNDFVGAPPDQIQILKSGENLDKLDFSKWKPVKLNAFVGEKNS